MKIDDKINSEIYKNVRSSKLTSQINEGDIFTLVNLSVKTMNFGKSKTNMRATTKGGFFVLLTADSIWIRLRAMARTKALASLIIKKLDTQIAANECWLLVPYDLFDKLASKGMPFEALVQLFSDEPGVVTDESLWLSDTRKLTKTEERVKRALKDPHTTYNLLTKRMNQGVYGLQNPISKLIGNVMLWLSGSINGIYSPVKNVIVTGPSGSGKSLLREQLQHAVKEVLGINMITIDATALVPEGYRGTSWSAAFTKHFKFEIRETNGLLICWIDEIDKILTSNVTSSDDENIHLDVANTLLNTISGITIDDYGTSGDTARVLFIFSGSFSQIELPTQSGSQIGFIKDEEDLQEEQNPQLNKIAIAKNAPSATVELIGRFGSIIYINPPKREYLINATKDHISRLSESLGIEITVEESVLSAWAQSDEAKVFGFRGALALAEADITKELGRIYENDYYQTNKYEVTMSITMGGTDSTWKRKKQVNSGRSEGKSRKTEYEIAMEKMDEFNKQFWDDEDLPFY